MDFIKKNWFKLCVIVLALVAAVFTLLKITVLPEGTEFKATITAWGIIVSLLGIIVSAIIAMFGKEKLAAWVLVTLSVVALILMTGWFKETNGLLMGTVLADFYAIALNLIVFAVAPIVYGLYKLELLKDVRSIFATIALAGFALALLMTFLSTETDNVNPKLQNANVGTLLSYIGIALVFAAIFAYAVLKNLGKDQLAKYVFAGFAVVAFILILTGLIMGLPYMNEVLDLAKKLGTAGDLYRINANLGTYTKLVTLTVFGVAPVAFACKKLFCKQDA